MLLANMTDGPIAGFVPSMVMVRFIVISCVMICFDKLKSPTQTGSAAWFSNLLFLQ